MEAHVMTICSDNMNIILQFKKWGELMVIIKALRVQFLICCGQDHNKKFPTRFFFYLLLC